MRRYIALASILVLLLSACAGEEEEGAPVSIGDMSARDILDEVVAAATSIDSVRVETMQTDTQHASPFPGTDDGEPQTSRGIRIITADGLYGLDETVLEDDCLPGADWCASSPFPMDETLWYKGKFYIRAEPDGEWVDPTKCEASPTACGGTGFGFDLGGSTSVVAYAEIPNILTGGDAAAADCDALRATPDPDATIDPSALEAMNFDATALYSMDFQNLSDVELMGEEVVGSVATVHLKGKTSMDFDDFGIPKEIQNLYEECGIPIPTWPPEAGMFEDYLPTRLETEFEVWVDDALHIIRLESTSRSYRGDRLLSTSTTDATYSLFNEADLPGPLPSS